MDRYLSEEYYYGDYTKMNTWLWGNFHLSENLELGVDPGRKAIEKNLVMQLAFENRPGRFGYPVLNGRGIEPSMMKRYPVNPGEEIGPVTVIRC